MLLIIALPRTGSTALLEACCQHSEVRGLFEPFREPSTLWNATPGSLYEDLLRRGEQAVLDEVCASYSCVKVVLGAYQPTLRFNLRWAHRPGVRTVVLTRRNVLRQAVSICLSMQSGVWQPWSASGVLQAPLSERARDAMDRHRSHDYQALDVQQTRALMWALMRRSAVLHGRAKRLGALELTYEDLFEQPSLDEQIAVVRRVLEHGGFDSSELERDEARRGIGELFGISRMNSLETYRRVPNIDEIEERLGSSVHGHLFR